MGAGRALPDWEGAMLKICPLPHVQGARQTLFPLLSLELPADICRRLRRRHRRADNVTHRERRRGKPPARERDESRGDAGGSQRRKKAQPRKGRPKQTQGEGAPRGRRGCAASQLFASSSRPALGSAPTWLPALSKAFAWLQASSTHQGHCCSRRHAQRQLTCSCQSPEHRLPVGHLPIAEALSSPERREVWGRPCTGMHLLAH